MFYDFLWLAIKFLLFATPINYIKWHQSPTTSRLPQTTVPCFGIFVVEGGLHMLQQLWDSFVLLIPVFFLLLMIFGAGFFIGRVSKKDS